MGRAKRVMTVDYMADSGKGLVVSFIFGILEKNFFSCFL